VDTPPNAAFIDDPAVVSDKRLDSFQIGFFEGVSPRLTFRHNFNLEASSEDPNLGFDGGVLEMSTDGGNTFQDILAAGGSFVIGATTAQSALIAVVRLLVVRLGAAIQRASLRPWSMYRRFSNLVNFVGGWQVTTAGQMRVGALTQSTLPGAKVRDHHVRRRRRQ